MVICSEFDANPLPKTIPLLFATICQCDKKTLLRRNSTECVSHTHSGWMIIIAEVHPFEMMVHVVVVVFLHREPIS